MRQNLSIFAGLALVTSVAVAGAAAPVRCDLNIDAAIADGPALAAGIARSLGADAIVRLGTTGALTDAPAIEGELSTTRPSDLGELAACLSSVRVDGRVAVRIAVIDRQRAVRLASETAIVPEDPAFLIDVLAAAIRRAAEKRGEPVALATLVLGASDFTSGNGRGQAAERNALARTVADRVEAMLLARPGVFVVETQWLASVRPAPGRSDARAVDGVPLDVVRCALSPAADGRSTTVRLSVASAAGVTLASDEQTIDASPAAAVSQLDAIAGRLRLPTGAPTPTTRPTADLLAAADERAAAADLDGAIAIDEAAAAVAPADDAPRRAIVERLLHQADRGQDVSLVLPDRVASIDRLGRRSARLFAHLRVLADGHDSMRGLLTFDGEDSLRDALDAIRQPVAVSGRREPPDAAERRLMWIDVFTRAFEQWAIDRLRRGEGDDDRVIGEWVQWIFAQSDQRQAVEAARLAATRPATRQARGTRDGRTVAQRTAALHQPAWDALFELFKRHRDEPRMASRIDAYPSAFLRHFETTPQGDEFLTRVAALADAPGYADAVRAIRATIPVPSHGRGRRVYNTTTQPTTRP